MSASSKSDSEKGALRLDAPGVKAGAEETARLLAIVAKLRDPDGGCPWDLEQTLASLRGDLIEEAYEALDASEREDAAGLAEELGDVLLQVALQSQVGADEGLFDFAQVARGIADKMVYRHPHVFGEATAKTPAEVLRNWDALKRGEKKERESALDGIPKGAPPLHRAYQLQKRAARAGFDWADVEGALAKLEEEVGEVREAVRGGNREEIMGELGDALFALVKVARFAKCDPHHALERTNRKFERRFRVMEAELKGRGKELKDCTLAEMEEIWNRQRREEKAAAAAAGGEKDGGDGD